jgi:hypothetical protein
MPIHPGILNLSVAFFHEATKILDDRKTPLNTLTACSALQLLCLSATGFGLDNDALTYFKQSVKIGKAMGLFGVYSEAESANTWLVDQEDWRRAASYTAWGVFNFVTYVFP